MIHIRVPAVPIAQPRQRHAVRQFGGKAAVVNYTPKKDPVNGFKATVRLAAEQAMNGSGPLDGPLVMTVVFVMPRPKAKVWKRRPMPRECHASRPDLDNLLKSAKDALSGLAWRDDAQVCNIHAQKVIAAGDEAPFVDIWIGDAT